MLKRYTFWFKTAIILQLLTGLIHSISLFINTEPANETERQIDLLTTTYKMDAGAGFHPTYSGLFVALSSCFMFLCIFAALINGYLLRKQTEPRVMKGIVAINLGVFGVLFVVMASLTFLPPILCTGLITISMLAAYVLVPKIGSAV